MSILTQYLQPTGESFVGQRGVGYNWFDYLGMGGSYARADQCYPLTDAVYPALDDERGWAAIYAMLDELRPGFIRFGLPPEPHVDAQGKFVAGTVHLERLQRVAQWAAKNGCTVLLDTFLLPKFYEMTVPEKPVIPNADGMLQMAARDNRELARHFIAPLLQHICKTMRLDAVRFFNPVNEPMCYGVYQTPADGPDMYAHYVDMFREIREALDALGISRNRLGLVGIDICMSWALKHFEALTRHHDIDPWVEAYAAHYYDLNFDHLKKRLPMAVDLDRNTRRLVDYCATRGKPFFATEIGTMVYGWRDNPPGAASYEAALTVAEGVIRALNCGVQAFAFWSLFNPNTIDGHWANVQWIDGKLEHVPAKRATLGELARVVRPGSTVHALRPFAADGQVFVHGTALQTPEPALLLVNDHPSATATVALRLPDAWKTPPATRTLCERHALHTVEARNWQRDAAGNWLETLPPESFAVYTG